jgi:hypothetical protein
VVEQERADILRAANLERCRKQQPPATLEAQEEAIRTKDEWTLEQPDHQTLAPNEVPRVQGRDAGAAAWAARRPQPQRQLKHARQKKTTH